MFHPGRVGRRLYTYMSCILMILFWRLVLTLSGHPKRPVFSFFHLITKIWQLELYFSNLTGHPVFCFVF